MLLIKQVMRDLLFLTFFLVLANNVFGYDTSEYINEFSNEGETCAPIDVFEYQQQDDWWIISHFSQTIPALYQCCKGDSCIAVIVDLRGKDFVRDDSFKELIDLNYIKHSIRTGNLTKTYFISNGLDLCQYHGSDRLNKESLSLVADTAEQIASVQKTKTAKQVTEVLYFARGLELVSPFSIADFALSVTCNYNDKKIKKAVEGLAECNLYLSHIQNNFARTSYVRELDTCMDDARYELKAYTEGDFAKIKNAGDKTANTIYAIYKLFKDLVEKPLEPKIDFKIEETEYGVALRVYNELEGKKIHLHNPNKEIIFANYADRIMSKRNEFNDEADNVYRKIGQAKDKVPNPVELFFTDVFYEPNHNISYAQDKIEFSSKNYDFCLMLFSEVKYNSAIACLDKSERAIDVAINILGEDLNINRKFDNMWEQLAFGILILVTIFIFVRLQRKRNTIA